MEMERVPAAGFPIIGLPVEGLQRKMGLRNFVVAYRLVVSLIKAKGILNSFRPDVVVGVGGYASGPLLRMAAWHGIPTVIQEQNSYAGITNRLLARKAAVICVAYQGMEQYFPAGKIILTGNPVREEVINTHLNKSLAAEFFGIRTDKPVLLVLGGSLGARTINESLLAHAEVFDRENVQLLWQTGRLYYEKIKEEIEPFGFTNIRYFDFINRMDLAYAMADVIISRAGAGTISELCLLGKPVILVPSPNVAEDHQTKNALALAEKEAALMIPDSEAKLKLVKTALQLLRDEPLKTKLGQNCSALAVEGSAEKIVDEILKLVKK